MENRRKETGAEERPVRQLLGWSRCETTAVWGKVAVVEWSRLVLGNTCKVLCSFWSSVRTQWVVGDCDDIIKNICEEKCEVGDKRQI